MQMGDTYRSTNLLLEQQHGKAAKAHAAQRVQELQGSATRKVRRFGWASSTPSWRWNEPPEGEQCTTASWQLDAVRQEQVSTAS